MMNTMRNHMRRSMRKYPFSIRLSHMPTDIRRSTHTTTGNQPSTQEHISLDQTTDTLSQSTVCSTDMETHTEDAILDTNNNSQELNTDTQLQLWITQHMDHQHTEHNHTMVDTQCTEL